MCIGGRRTLTTARLIPTARERALFTAQFSPAAKEPPLVGMAEMTFTSMDVNVPGVLERAIGAGSSGEQGLGEGCFQDAEGSRR